MGPIIHNMTNTRQMSSQPLMVLAIGRTKAWFNKYGDLSVFTTRFIPIFRTFISIPAGNYVNEIKNKIDANILFYDNKINVHQHIIRVPL